MGRGCAFRPWLATRGQGQAGQQQPRVRAKKRHGPRLPDDAGGPLRRLICYRSTRPGWAGPMARSERLAEPESLAEAAQAVVEAAAVAPEAGDSGAAATADVLVCTHGRRDTCCGARGMELLGALGDAPRFGQPGRAVVADEPHGRSPFRPNCDRTAFSEPVGVGRRSPTGAGCGRRRSPRPGAPPVQRLCVPRLACPAGGRESRPIGSWMAVAEFLAPRGGLG